MTDSDQQTEPAPARRKYRPVILKGGFWLMVGLISFLLLLVMTLEEPSVLVAAELETESVEVRVRNPDQMIIELPRATADLQGEETCAEAIRFSVAQHSSIYMTAMPDGSAVIATGGPTRWTSQTIAGEIVEEEGAYFVVSAAEGDCSWSGRLRLPISGELTAGMTAAGDLAPSELRTLLSGQLKIYGRASETIFGIIPLSLLAGFTPLEPGKLFNAGSFDIPAGSRLEGGNARFWGFADLEITTDGDPVIHVHASTNARELSIFAPAPRFARGGSEQSASTLKADTLSMTFGTRLANDPNLHVVFAGLSAIFLILGLLLGRAAGHGGRS